MPYIDLNISIRIEVFDQDYQERYSAKKEVLQDDKKINALNNTILSELNKINKVIYDKLQLNDIETALIEYALEINKTFIIGNDEEKARLFLPLK